MTGVLRSLQRRSARLAALGALLAAASCTREAEVPHPVIDEGDVECRLGLAGVAEDDRWSLFRVRVRNRGADFRGEMVVRGVSAATEDAVSYRMALEIPGGSSAWREYSFPVKPEGWSELHTTLRGHDFGKTFSTDVPLTEARAFRVLMIGEASVDLSALKSYVAGELKVGATDQSPAREPKLSRITPAEMPPLAVAYEPFQLVLLLCSTLESAPEGAIDALGDWVGSGGTLAAFSGPAWAGGVPEKLRALLGIELQGNDRRIALAEGSREVEDGVAIVSRPGLGSATTFTLLQGTGGASVFPSPAGAPSVYRALDACFGRAVSFAGDSGAGLRAIEHQIGLSLYLLAGVRLPSRGAVVLGLLVYALLGFVVPAWIFKRLGRREWSFAVMVAAAIAAAFAIYQLGVFSSIGGAEVDEVSIVRMAPGSAVVRAASYLGLISPGFDTIGIAAPGALPHPLRSERREPWRRGEHMTVPRTDVQVVKGRELRLAPIRLFPNAMHLVRLDHEARADEVLLVERVPRDDGKNDIRLVNRGKSHLEFFLVERGRRALSRPLEPGEEAILPEWRSFRFEDLPVVDSYRYVVGGEGPEAQAAVSMALRAVALPQESEEPNYLAPQPIKRDGAAKRPWDGDAPRFLVALSRDPVFPAVDGVRKRKALSLYVVELSREDAP